MEFKELIEKRRSIRKFSERAVPREVVDRILHETLSAPSARNSPAGATSIRNCADGIPNWTSKPVTCCSTFGPAARVRQ